MNWTELKPLDISKITKVDFPDNQYYKEETNKNQIVLHHTVSGIGVDGDITTWLNDPTRVATHVIIDREGKIFQCYSSKMWAHHIGMKAETLKSLGFSDYATRNELLNKSSFAIEIDNYGWLDKQPDGKFKTCYGNVVNVPVVEFATPFRGHKYYEKYTEAQIKSAGELILLIAQKYNIPLDYNEDMWDVSKNALSGKPGIYTHVSYRNDKSDCSGQLDLISMLKSLKK